MVERLMAYETVDEYRKLGGVLDQNSFEVAQEVLKVLTRGEKLGPLKKCCLLQAQNLLERDWEPMTPEQRQAHMAVYAVLRDAPIDNDENPNQSQEDQGTLSPCKMGDRQLFEEVGKITRVVNL